MMDLTDQVNKSGFTVVQVLPMSGLGCISLKGTSRPTSLQNKQLYYSGTKQTDSDLLKHFIPSVMNNLSKQIIYIVNSK